MVKKILLTFFLVLVQTVVFAVTKTYNATSGNWNTAANWSPSGVPSSSDDVVIPTGSTVTMISTPVTISTFTIYGQLVLLPDSSHTINTTSLIVVSPSGSILFDKKSKIILPSNTLIQVSTGGLLGDCSNNNSIFIGSVEVAVCAGGGSTIPTFNEVMVSGGYNIVNISPASASVCGSGSFSFTATAIPSASATIKWYDAASGGNLLQTGTLGSSNTYTTPIISTTTTYYADATVGLFTTQRKAVVATVNPLPTITGNLNVCEGSTTNLTGSATANATTPWTSATTSVATVSSSGVVTGVSEGTSVITYRNSNGCTQTATVVVASLVNNVTNGFSGSSFCVGEQTTLTFDANNGSGVYPYTLIYRNDTTNATASVTIANDDSTTFNVLPNPIVTTHYTLVSITDAKGCVRTTGFGDSTARVTINALPNTPTIAITQPSCAITTATITITGVAGETYSFDGGVFSTTLVYSGLAQGSSHTISAKNSSGCISAVANVTINTLSTKTWNGSWSPAGAPTSNDLVIINADYSTSSNGDLNACSLIINLGSTLTVEEGKFVVIQNDLTVNGTLDVLDKGSLVMVNDSGIVTNSGTTNIHRFTTPFKKYDYTYWSTPVVSTNIASTFLGWNTGYSYEYLPANFLDANNDGLDDDGNDWSFASTMTPGKGYIVMVPTPIASGPFANNPSEVVFSGKVNNGIQKITSVLADSSYLIGNPYPSALDADAFLDYNSGVLDGTLYFWTHNTAIQAANASNASLGTGAYAFTSDDYASYNAVGGVGVGSGTAASTGGAIPNGKIASGQGFFALSKVAISGTNEIVFNNSMRLSSGGAVLDNSQFFKTRNPKGKVASSIEKNRIWLNMTNTKGAFKQTLVGYVTNATNDYDGRFDGVSFDGNEFVDFYSINQDKNLTIQGRALPFDENDQVPLGYRTTISGTFSINIGQVDGVLANQSVFLEDKLTNTVFNLKNGNYTFETEAGTFDNRFVLKYKPSDKTLSVDEMDASDGIVVLYSNNHKTLIIRNNVEDAVVNSVTLFNMSGQKISCWDIKEGEQANIQIPMNNINSEIYIVKVKTTKGETSKKIVIKQ
ncbi:G8 domain-containing protein [Flavobacterium limnophilum]|uniref:Ig-like domain-containing protein n=1 Tax=Flavobacterium limnophilum TaxID=3003262 RepID=UPI0024826689|nr:G8 domain-containing protein [Flavobacterium limnophilum]